MESVLKLSKNLYRLLHSAAGGAGAAGYDARRDPCRSIAGLHRGLRDVILCLIVRIADHRDNAGPAAHIQHMVHVRRHSHHVGLDVA